MKIGRFTIEQLSEGQFEAFNDGRFNKLDPGEEDPTPIINLPVQTSTTIGIDPILVSDGEFHVLLDTGLGWGLDAGSRYKKISNVRTNLDIFNLSPEDITHVILTHLHYDHAAGCTYTDVDSQTRATFPNARYYLQRREWEYAVDQVDRPSSMKGPGYNIDDLYRLFVDNKLVLLEDDFHEIIPGIKTLWTGGHSPGHQIVRIYDGEKSAFYLGDLLPSDKHLNQYAMRYSDLYPTQAKKMKIQLMRKVCNENACLLFYHSLFSKVGMLVKDEKKKYMLKDL